MLEFADELPGPKIKVIGVGGGGGNSVNTMIEAGVQGVDFVAANTDCQVLDTNMAGVKVHMGKALTKGLGAGANPEIGCAAAIEDASRLAEVLQGADMVFVTAGMGGGTGTGAAPVIAQVARDMGALTVGVVTKPFAFEGLQRKKKASGGIAELAKAVDALIVIPNDRLVALAGMKMTLRESFAMVDSVCVNAVRGISDLVMVPGLINVDFADVRTIMTGMGRALMGTGRGTGDKRAIEAAEGAINSPLLEDVSINGATGILVNITGGPDLTLAEVNEACSLIQEAADPDANIIFGSVIDPNCKDEVRITVIATGFQSAAAHELPTPGNARGARRPSENQMALPMQPAPMAHPLGATPVAPLYTQGPEADPVGPARAAGGQPVATAWPPAPEPIDIGDLASDAYTSMAMSQPAPYPGGPISPFPPAAPMTSAPSAPVEWVQAGESRPNIRPPVTSSQSGGGGLSGPRRVTSAPPASASLTVEDLGIDESEFDKPTYLRRAHGAQEGAAPAYRGPGDGKHY
jgi:cell division protein FtsZ